ncbi:hypothetical protein BpHYR1_010130 [Brachionus plicatilis]|uniref:Transmembrane protein n=1 Tax=Brachionus plicatilis TaxID=10195 RepID=A0A3M7RA40_BRAPC|nr:hypothetical protein BpHYR1_010130 [Brachionus plicatilis]
MNSFRNFYNCGDTDFEKKGSKMKNRTKMREISNNLDCTATKSSKLNSKNKQFNDFVQDKINNKCIQSKFTQLKPDQIKANNSIFNDSDIVLVTPIKTNCLNIHRNCTGCIRLEILQKDCQLYAQIIQLIFCILVLSLVYLSIQKFYDLFQECDQDYCPFEMCHLNVMILSLIIMNSFTYFIIWYDYHQALKNAQEIDTRVFILLLFSGGCITGWLGFILGKLSMRFRNSMVKFGIFFSVFNLYTIGIALFFSKSIVI